MTCNQTAPGTNGVAHGGYAARATPPDPLEGEVEARLLRLVREPDGTIRLWIGPERGHDRVQAVRLRPLSDPEHYVSFLDERGEEICLVRDPTGLDEASHRVLREELDRRYLTAVVRRIHTLRSEQGVHYFDVETDRGRREYVVQNLAENARWLGPRRVLLLDTYGNRFEVHDLDALDRQSARLLERAL